MPDLTGLLSAARTAAEVAARHAAAADTDRRLADDVVEALLNAGFARRFVPEHLGGAPVGFTELMESVAAVAEGCASAGWVASLMAQGARISGYLPAEGQAEVWAKGADTLVVVGFVSQGRVREVDGGWVLSGTWPYVSGIEFSQWALVLADADDGPRFFAVPRSEYDYDTSWFTLGMRATGSHALALDEVFVPAHRSFPRDEMFLGRPSVSREPFHTAPLFAVNGLTFGAPILGAARGALAVAGAALPPRDAARLGYARAAGEIEAATLLLTQVADRADQGRYGDAELRAASRDSALAVDLLAVAVDRLFAESGTRGQRETQPLNRIWRDVRAAAGHGALRFEPAAMRFTEPLVSA
ncbi:acyl-CoA dehydrogenase family protein [Streptomyces sp. NPDC127190]|uniref:acyl-CoA dehydrogenase family protein n=1 Tax=unclassified Streptomyces TaxID=2593676 RepID=UPI00362998DF